MHNHDSFLANSICELLELLRGFMVPPCSDGLKDKPGFLKVLRVRALPDFVGGGVRESGASSQEGV
jgi:hypothetical protein